MKAYHITYSNIVQSQIRVTQCFANTCFAQMSRVQLCSNVVALTSVVLGCLLYQADLTMS